MHYQPSISIRSGKILGVEALVRWQRSKDELIPPDDFIPVAEKIGLIDDIGDWVLRSACLQNSAWQQAGHSPIRMAVNVSVRQLQRKNFPQRILRILQETKLESKWLELELTETALMDNLDAAPATFEQLRALGIGISIDDFGTRVRSPPAIQTDRTFTVSAQSIRCSVRRSSIRLPIGSVSGRN